MVDLHSHSNYSDGSLSPQELIVRAEESGLSALALTDHNTIQGLPDFLEAAKNSQVRPVPGAEFSTDYHGVELHILGLFIPEEHYADVTDFVSALAERKKQSNYQLEQALQAANYDIHLEEMLATKPENGQINRADFASELERKGYMSRREAFQTVLRRGNGFYVPPQRPDVLQTIAFIRSIGAVPVWAHPYLSLKDSDVETFAHEAAARGLVAMETYYSTYDEPTTHLAKKVAASCGLLESGGSDFHGDPKPSIALGTGRGNLHVPDRILDELEQAAKTL